MGGKSGDSGKALEELLSLLQRTEPLAEGDYFGSPLPSQQDGVVADLVARFAVTDEPLRKALRQHLRNTHVGVLGSFAVRMASLAVREGSTERLRLGLLAIALASDSPESDWRDLTRLLTPLEDAALRIPGGVAQARDAFAEAARLTEEDSKVPITWCKPPRWQLLRLLMRLRFRLLWFDWKAIEAEDGFRYVVANPVTKEFEEYLVDTLERARRGEHIDEEDLIERYKRSRRSKPSE